MRRPLLLALLTLLGSALIAQTGAPSDVPALPESGPPEGVPPLPGKEETSVTTPGGTAGENPDTPPDNPPDDTPVDPPDPEVTAPSLVVALATLTPQAPLPPLRLVRGNNFAFRKTGWIAVRMESGATETAVQAVERVFGRGIFVGARQDGSAAGYTVLRLLRQPNWRGRDWEDKLLSRLTLRAGVDAVSPVYQAGKELRIATRGLWMSLSPEADAETLRALRSSVPAAGAPIAGPGNLLFLPLETADARDLLKATAILGRQEGVLSVYPHQVGVVR